MLKRILSASLIAFFLPVLAVSVWAQRGPGRGMQGSGNGGMCLALIGSIAKQPLDPTEATELAYMREEEKLAHDVYATLHSRWNLPIFGNISRSEEQHFNALKLLLDRYALPDPAANSPVGAFQNSGLRSLYGDLIAQGGRSLTAALRVGATIEDLDIRDLEKAAASTDNNDLKLVYQNLRQGSENHMRAFIRQLEAAGESYTPQYISQAGLAEILASPQQTGSGIGARGNGQRGFGRGNKGTCPRMTP
jgi:hypothetical protein